jgi:hypothetical protein
LKRASGNVKGIEVKNDCDRIYDALRKKLSVDTLKEITADIIHAYKYKNPQILHHYAVRIGLDGAGISVNKLFAKLVQTYHPDKFESIIRDIESQWKNGQLSRLRELDNIYTSRVVKREIQLDYQEQYDLSMDDFFYHGMGVVSEKSIFGSPGIRVGYGAKSRDRSGKTGQGGRVGFTDALHRELCGGFQYELTTSDLRALRGELDLSDCGITHLDGVQKCTHITGLVLAGNRIQDLGPLSTLASLQSLDVSCNRVREIGCLRGLVNLTELDVSGNRLSDVDVLLHMEKLRYVNLCGSVAVSDGTVAALRDRSVLVAL